MSGDFKFIFHWSSGTSPPSGEDWCSSASWRRTAVSETAAESRLHPLQRGGFSSTKVSWSQTSSKNAGDSSKGTVAMPQNEAQLIMHGNELRWIQILVWMVLPSSHVHMLQSPAPNGTNKTQKRNRKLFMSTLLFTKLTDHSADVPDRWNMRTRGSKDHLLCQNK